MTPTPRTDEAACSLNEVVRRFTNAAMPTQVIVDGMELVNADFARKLEREVVALREVLLDKRPEHGYWDRTCDWQRIQDDIDAWNARRQAALDATDGRDRA